jgi:hypothetical protein
MSNDETQAAYASAKAAIDAAMVRAIDNGGWKVSRRQRATTGTLYLDLTRAGTTLTVRVGDHGGAHWRPTDLDIHYGWPGTWTDEHNARELAKLD